jgi:membrane protein DedA with SNARE-associated domain
MPLQEFQAWIANYGYPAIFFLLVLGIVGLPVPDETLLTLTGYLVFNGTLKAVPSFACAFLGTVTGITVSYLIGKAGGRRFLHRFGNKLHIKPEAVDRVHSWFHRWGHWTLTVGYFIPGVRHVIAIVAGSTGLEYRIFSMFAYTGAFFWAGIFLFAGYYLGERWQAFPETMTTVAIWVLAAVLAGGLAFGAIRVIRNKKSGRKSSKL